MNTANLKIQRGDDESRLIEFTQGSIRIIWRLSFRFVIISKKGGWYVTKPKRDRRVNA